MSKENLFDLIIIGGAAAGMAAAVYAARRKLNFAVVTKDIGGEVALSGIVNNWPGTIDIEGFELAQNFAKHAKSYDVDIREGWVVTGIKPIKNIQELTVTDNKGKKQTIKSKAVIIASGIHPRELKVPGEKELKNRGVTYCTVCDGPLFKDKVTITVGAGNSALESALMMGGIASKVYVLSKYPNTPQTQGGFPKGERILIDKMKEMKNVEILYEALTTEIIGANNKVNGLKYKDINGKETKLDAEGVMVHIGFIPNSQFVNCAKKNKAGEIVVDVAGRTSCRGVFAAGDVTTVPFKQIGIAAGQGITAALTAIDYINRWK